MLKRHSGDRFEVMVGNVAEYTGANEHTLALVEIAVYFATVDHAGNGVDDSKTLNTISARLHAIDRKHRQHGSLSVELRAVRNEVADELLQMVRQVTTADEYRQLRHSL